MKKALMKKMGLLLASVMTFSAVFTLPDTSCFNGNIRVYAAENNVIVSESGGWHESAYVKWKPYSNADSYNVYYRKNNENSYTKIEKELIRQYEDHFRADVYGLAKGEYILKVVPVYQNEEKQNEASETPVLTVDNFVREGFAFSEKSPCGYTTGGYNKDGTISPLAEIVYVTNENKNTVTINGDESKGVGIVDILAKRKKVTTPLIIRFIGKIQMPDGVENYMMSIFETDNVTVEGVGDDATIYGWGFTMKRAKNIEVRNIGIMLYGGYKSDGDSLSLDTDNKNIWMHHIDFFYGEQGKDADQKKGDGSIDLKARSDYITVSHNHFWDSGKTCVAGGVWEAGNPDDPRAKIFVTYHHNWFDHSDSRHPRCVAASVHVYNNYYDGVADYGIGSAVKSSVFAEGNYFRNCPRPMLIATQGSECWDNATQTYKDKGSLSGQIGGMIKEYDNYIVNARRFYTQITTPDEGQIDAYHVEKRDEIVPDTVKAMSGGHTYNNFDTSEDMYEYTPHKSEEVPSVVTADSGRIGVGDFKWEFTASDDYNKDVNDALKSALVNYTSKIVKTYVDHDPNSEESSTQSTTENTTQSTTENINITGHTFGDIDGNGKITAKDVAYLSMKAKDNNYKLPDEDDLGLSWFDMDGDGKITLKDASILLKKVRMDDFEITTKNDGSKPSDESTQTSTEESTQSSTEESTQSSTEESTQTSTEESTQATTGASEISWNADDSNLPDWLVLSGYTSGNKSSSQVAFKDTDSSVGAQKKRYSCPANSEITIDLNSASTVKVYLAGDDNSDGKGTATAELDGVNMGTYTLPGRQTSSAEPFVITTEKGGTLKITNSFKALLFKVVISGSTSQQPAENEKNYDVTVKVTNSTGNSADLKIGENTFSADANSVTEKVINLTEGNHSVAVLGTKAKANPSSINVKGHETIEIEIEEISINVIVSDKDGGYIGGYETISEALSAESTVNGSILSVKSGYYNETFEVSKSITLKKSEDEDGEVIIYSSNGSYGGSMKGIIRVAAENVTFKDLTLLNNTNASYAGIAAASESGSTAAALIPDGSNGTYDNCKFISVQDTIVSANKKESNIKQTYNNCTFYGATDFVCGGSTIDFNNCEFRIFSGSLASKDDSYIFAPNVTAKWTVNGGRIINDETSIVKNFFYARAWESNSSNTQTLDIFGIENNLKMGEKGLMGFGSSTGSGASHSINEFQFNVYEGKDKNSPLIATSNVTKIDIFELDKTSPVIEFANNSSANLIVGIFGNGLSDKFIQNILPDIMEIGYVSEENANADSISNENTVRITGVYKLLKSNQGGKYSLSQDLQAGENLLGTGILSGIDGEKTVKIVPYVKYDPITDSNRGNDLKPTYKFGTPVEVTVKGNGQSGNKTEPAEGFKILENGNLGEVAPSGIGENIYSNVF